MERRTFLQMSALSALLTRKWAAAKGDGSKPNILFLFTDDHAVQSIGAYGSRINETPNIDRLAREGTVFDRCFCCNSICAPSRAAILTGKHSHANGLMTNQDTFEGRQLTFPKVLQKAGYKTALIGKWHLKTDPTGFDHWEILPGQGSYYNPDFKTQEKTTHYIGYATDITTDLAIDWLDSQSGDEPFLLMCQHKAPHRTWAPPPEFLHLYDDQDIPEPDSLFDDYSGRNEILQENEMSIAGHLMYDYDLKVSGSKKPDKLGRTMENPEVKRMNPQQRAAWDAAYGPKNEKFLKDNPQGRDLVRWKYQRYIKDYLRCIASVDKNIGRVLDYLDDKGLTENTIVVYSSDQGFYLGEHGWYDKRWMYEESMRMPLIVRWPGVVKGGERISSLVQNIDFGPTFLDAAGVDVPREIQGMSMVPLLNGGDKVSWRHSVYYHYYEKGEHNVPQHEGVRTDRYKLIRFTELNEWELFDLQNDPSEMKSVYDDPAYAEIRMELLDELMSLKRRYQVPGARGIIRKATRKQVNN
jgi:arylsulfatase A-like enzyme